MKRIAELHNAAVELRAAGTASTDLPLIKQTISVLQDMVDRAERLSAVSIVVGEDGNVELLREFQPDPVMEVSAEGIDLEAGERLSTALKKYRIRNNMTVADMVQNLPFGADIYIRLERGEDLQLSDDLLSALSTMIGTELEDLKRMYQMDVDYPVTYYVNPAPSYHRY